jgi:hypothetical protein
MASFVKRFLLPGVFLLRELGYHINRNAEIT